MQYHFHSSEYRLLTNPKNEHSTFYHCWKMQNIWFVQSWYDKRPLCLRVFDDDKLFEQFYKRLKKQLKGYEEEQQTDIPVYDVKFDDYKNCPF